MFTLTLSASELDALRATHPEIAKKARPARTSARRAPAVKKSPIPPAVQRDADKWAERAAYLRTGTPDAQRTMENDARILRDVIALHRGLPRPE